MPLLDISHSSNVNEADDNQSYYPRFLLPCIRGTEELEDYAPGGFHPVHLGDTFDGGRYVIVHKLGAGGFAAIWLAQDMIKKTWVALKIVRAKESIQVGLKSAPIL
jgi:serine/threonine-protein kinase SRPK3